MDTLRTLLRWLGNLLLTWGALPVSEHDAVFEAFKACGLPADQYTDSFDLTRTGKTYEVLHIAAERLGVNHELHTVGDVKRWLM